MALKPLHDDGTGPQAPEMAAAASTDSLRRRRRRRGAVSLIGAALLAPVTTSAQHHHQHQHHPEPLALTPAARAHRVLADGLTACANCNTATLKCSGTTVQDQHCAPCASGQTWWPCNLPDECYCKDLTAVETPPERPDCEIPLCGPGESGSRVVPFTNCEMFTVCTAGIPGPEQACAPGQLFSESINACNIKNLVQCPPDPVCPPTGSPTLGPRATDAPTTEYPTSAAPTEKEGFTYVSGGARPGVNVGDSSAAIQAQTSAPPRIDPSVLEGMHVMDAHVAANKIVLTRELLTGPSSSRGRGASGASAGGDFSYVGFRDSLHHMIAVGAADRTFYIGHSGVENGRAYGLVNIAMFLAMSHEDSIAHGSCDEVNRDIVGGVLPVANACGQYGLEYETLTCPDYGDGIDYSCPVDPSMATTAGRIDPRGTEEGVPQPLYCRPKEFAGDYTGHWDYVSGSEVVDAPAANAAGRRDVQGCCWWGRGSIQLRGPCAYGRLNYHLGARAAAEGRPALFPDVNFCADPGAVCSHPKYPELRWIAGIFRWITDVQTYNQGEFSYMQRLIDFVDGGMQDWSFVHGVSGIVAQGCHRPPCGEGMEFDGAERKATFIKTLRLLGLRVDDGTAKSRRLGGSSR